jgi:hypothetical protein
MAGPREVYFEFTAIGASVKVVAIDAATGTEVSVIGPASAAQADLERLALAKLKKRLTRRPYCAHRNPEWIAARFPGFRFAQPGLQIPA